MITRSDLEQMIRNEGFPPIHPDLLRALVYDTIWGQSLKGRTEEEKIIMSHRERLNNIYDLVKIGNPSSIEYAYSLY